MRFRLTYICVLSYLYFIIKTITVMKTAKIYRTWGKPYGKGQSVVCEMSAFSKKEAVKKLEANGVVLDDKKHIWKA
jgi:hypothetical protein